MRKAIRPKHDVIVEHDWGVPILHPQGSTSTLSVRTCLRCGVQHRNLVLDGPRDTRSVKELAQSNVEEDQQHFAAAMKELAGMFGQCLEPINSLSEELDELCDGTVYRDLQDFAEQLEKRHQGAVQAGEVTFGIARDIIPDNKSRQGKRHSRKVFLAFRQGLVCDICDRVVHSLDDLEEEHILPRALGGESMLKNLRLACRTCNRNKADKPPTDSDISPFEYQGEPCKHRVGCGELERRP